MRINEQAVKALWGIDWYPEQWDRSYWESDISRMVDQGFQMVRLMEFAWASLESEPGRYDFSIFDEVIALLAGKGLSVVIGTPTASFPAHLVARYPDILAVHPTRLDRDFGSRRMGCLNAPSYQAAADAIVHAIVERYGHNPAVAGWQIDNELGHEGSDLCVCAHCRSAWPVWLEKKYGDISALHQAWGTVFWAAGYRSFSEIPVPRRQLASGHNPALLLDYDRFCSDSAIAWARRQKDIIRAGAQQGQWITTNLYPAPLGQCIDMETLLADMDVPGWDNYPVWGEQAEPYPYFFTAYALSYIRGLRPEGRFKVMEQYAGKQGHTLLGYDPPPGQMAAWTNQAFARGADSLFYFRWRTAAFAQEQLCSGLRDTDNQATQREAALIDNMTKTGEVWKRLIGIAPPAEACLVYDRDNARLIGHQALSSGLDKTVSSFVKAGFDMEMARFFAPFALFNVNADVKSVRALELDRYRLISLPLYQLSDAAFVCRLSDWVSQGGTLVLGWRAGTRKPNNHNYDKTPPGPFRELAGLRVSGSEALGSGRVGLRLGLLPCMGEVWAERLEIEGARVIARYRDKRKWYSASAAITVHVFGKGRVWYLGTSPGPSASFLLYRRILREAGLKPLWLGFGVEAVRRLDDNGGETLVVINHTSKRKMLMGRLLDAWGTMFVRQKGQRSR